MSKQFYDTELISKEREDIFDIYYNKIESFKLELIKEGRTEISPKYSQIEKALTILERNLDDLAKFELKQPEIVKLGNSTIQKMLQEWNDIFNTLGKRIEFISDFAYNVLIASAILSNVESLNSLTFQKYLKWLSPKREDRINYENNIKSAISFNSNSHYTYLIDKFRETKGAWIKGLLEGDETDETTYDNLTADILAKSIKTRRENDSFKSIYFDELLDIEIEKYRSKINSKKIVSEIIEAREHILNSSFEWSVTLKFQNDNDEYKANQIGYSIWAISEALEKIDGISITLEDSGKGSRWFRFKLKIKDLLGKEEVKQVLNKSKEAIESQYLDKPIEEAKKIKAEREKVEKETKVIANEEDTKKIRSLEIEKLELENESTKVNIMKSKLELIQGISKLIADGIIQNDSKIQLTINDMLFIEKDNDGLKYGEDIELIEEDGIIKSAETDDVR
jgi:hypothetical protein